ncbi:hypothetical protein HY798_03720 [Candidatus Falkowbacteria bacterium]|nr:hypothetical protein [Candidatus Falkowbacteria bacterium]
MIQKDVSAVEEMGKTGAQRAKFSTLGEVGSTSQFLSRTGPGATKGSAADLNTVNKAKTGFAGQTSKSNNTSGHNTPPSSVRSKPLGIGPGSRL